MRSRDRPLALGAAAARALLLLAACGGGDGGGVAVVRLDEGLELPSAWRQAAIGYYAEHADDRDLLVVWDTSSRHFGSLAYVPVANDVAGIGYRNVGFGEDRFDVAADYGSARLQGVIWIGSRWRLIPDQGRPAPDSALGIVAAETMHRWAAMVHRGTADADDLLASDGLHWSGLVDAGDSPLAGYRWQDGGDGTFTRVASAGTAAADLDLYLMGLLPVAEIAPLRLLTEVSAGVCSQPETCADGWRDGPPDVVTAIVAEVGVDQIVQAEGPRDPAGSAPALRQAWIYAVHGDAEPDPADLERLEALRPMWEAFYAGATRGLGTVTTAP